METPARYAMRAAHRSRLADPQEKTFNEGMDDRASRLPTREGSGTAKHLTEYVGLRQLLAAVYPELARAQRC